jgi:hypothetical protein
VKLLLNAFRNAGIMGVEWFVALKDFLKISKIKFQIPW